MFYAGLSSLVGMTMVWIFWPLFIHDKYHDRRTAFVLALIIFMSTFIVYLSIGNPSAIWQKSPGESYKPTIENLKSQLHGRPNDPKIWANLAQVYKQAHWFDLSVQAFVKAQNVVDQEPNLLVDYADLLATKQHHRLKGQPAQLVQHALKLNPRHPTALVMSGVAAYQQSDFPTAIAQWTKVLAMLPPDSLAYQTVQSEIDKAVDNR